MFYIQQKINSYCLPATRENFLQVIDNPFVEETINKIRNVQKKMDEAQARGDKKAVLKLHDQKGNLKKSLPAWLFCVSHIEKTERKPFGKPMMAAWRKAEQARLNGLVFLDIDGIEEPAKAFAKVVEAHKASPSGDGFEGGTPSWCGNFCKQYGILFVHVTPSGKGLRFVFKADPERGNLADNQTWLSDVLGMEMDEVCKDSVRISFGCSRRDIIYIELENLLNYENEEFETKFGDEYRKGNSAPTHDGAAGANGTDNKTAHGNGKGSGEGNNLDASASAEEGEKTAIELLEKDEYGNPVYRGVPYKDIADAWLFSTLGHLPAVGERNSAYYALVQGCMRYICDFNEDMVVAATPDYGLSEQERRTCARSAIGSRRYAAMPRKLVEFLEGMGVAKNADGEASGIRKGDDDASGLAQWDFEAWTKRFAPWFESPVWAPVCSVLPRYSRLNGILAAGSMFGTLLSGCRLQNWYDGSDLSLTYMTYIIGDAGTGKGDYRELDRLIMEPLRLEDARGRKAEENYQAEMKRLALAKAKKEDIPEEKHFPVRYLPTDTTLKQKLERCMDAINLFGTQQRQVACYNFESELSSKINYEKSSWNSSQDFDKKSFDCELTGSESRSAMTRNGLVPAFFNFVVTGTPDSLQKKITPRNCLDGLPTRLIMGVQYGQRYEMLKRQARRRSDKDSNWLRTVGCRLLRCGWDVNLEQRVAVPKRWQPFLGKSTSFADALYYWGQQKAFALSLEDDRLGDYFRKRPPLIAVRLAAVDAILNSLDTFEETGKLNLKFSSIELALNLADYIFESQLWFFGKLVEDALNGVPAQVVNKRSMKRIEAFNSLGETFSAEDVMDFLNILKKSAQNIITTWAKENYVERISKNKFKKLVKIIV